MAGSYLIRWAPQILRVIKRAECVLEAMCVRERGIAAASRNVRRAPASYRVSTTTLSPPQSLLGPNRQRENKIAADRSFAQIAPITTTTIHFICPPYNPLYDHYTLPYNGNCIRYTTGLSCLHSVARSRMPYLSLLLLHYRFGY